MPLLGSAAMLLCFDVVADAIVEHDHWHTHEHLPERLSIPGFLRGTRWVAPHGSPRYMVLYEVDSLSTLASDAYRERLDHPTPWTTRTMPHYRAMSRGLCSVKGSFGFGTGHCAALVRFNPCERADEIHGWLLREVLPALPTRAGLGSAHLLHAALAAAMTNEQRIRGADRGADSALIVTGYDDEAVAEVARTTLGPSTLERRGATDASLAVYRLDYSLERAEIGA